MDSLGLGKYRLRPVDEVKRRRSGTPPLVIDFHHETMEEYEDGPETAFLRPSVFHDYYERISEADPEPKPRWRWRQHPGRWECLSCPHGRTGIAAIPVGEACPHCGERAPGFPGSYDAEVMTEVRPAEQPQPRARYRLRALEEVMRSFPDASPDAIANTWHKLPREVSGLEDLQPHYANATGILRNYYAPIEPDAGESCDPIRAALEEAVRRFDRDADPKGGGIFNTAGFQQAMKRATGEGMPGSLMSEAIFDSRADVTTATEGRSDSHWRLLPRQSDTDESPPGYADRELPDANGYEDPPIRCGTLQPEANEPRRARFICGGCGHDPDRIRELEQELSQARELTNRETRARLGAEERERQERRRREEVERNWQLAADAANIRLSERDTERQAREAAERERDAERSRARCAEDVVDACWEAVGPRDPLEPATRVLTDDIAKLKRRAEGWERSAISVGESLYQAGFREPFVHEDAIAQLARDRDEARERVQELERENAELRAEVVRRVQEERLRIFHAVEPYQFAAKDCGDRLVIKLDLEEFALVTGAQVELERGARGEEGSR